MLPTPTMAQPTRKKRILLGELEQETATFNPAPTGRAMFRESQGEQILEEYGGTTTQLGAALDLLATREDIAVVPTFAASSVSGGPIPTADLDSLIAALTGALAAAKADGPVDGIYLRWVFARGACGWVRVSGVCGDWLRVTVCETVCVCVCVCEACTAPWRAPARTTRRARC
eukprot:COSAG03_NODE_3961_length_1740_cov_66.195612_2_plen_173_part_00